MNLEGYVYVYMFVNVYILLIIKYEGELGEYERSQKRENGYGNGVIQDLYMKF